MKRYLDANAVKQYSQNHVHVHVRVYQDRFGWWTLSRSPMGWSYSYGDIPCPRKWREFMIVDKRKTIGGKTYRQWHVRKPQTGGVL